MPGLRRWSFTYKKELNWQHGTWLPGYLYKTDDMIFDIDFSGGVIQDKCWHTISYSGVTTTNDGNNYVWVFDGSHKITEASSTLFSKSSNLFIGMWLKRSGTQWADTRPLSWWNPWEYSWMCIWCNTDTNWYLYGKEDANRWWRGTWTETWFDTSEWHLVNVWYDGSTQTSYLYVDWVYRTSVTNTYQGYWSQWSTPWNNMWWLETRYFTWQIGQIYWRTTRPTDAEILAAYITTRPAT